MAGGLCPGVQTPSHPNSQNRFFVIHGDPVPQQLPLQVCVNFPAPESTTASNLGLPSEAAMAPDLSPQDLSGCTCSPCGLLTYLLSVNYTVHPTVYL